MLGSIIPISIMIAYVIAVPLALSWARGYDDANIRGWHNNKYKGPWAYAYNRGYYRGDTADVRYVEKQQKHAGRLLRNKEKYDTLVFNKTNPDK